MVAIAFATLLLTVSTSPDITYEQAYQTANSFKAIAALGVLSDYTFVMPDYSGKQDQYSPPDLNLHLVDYDDGYCSIFSASGRIFMYSFSINNNRPGSNRRDSYYPFRPTLTEAEAVQKARDYLAAAGHPENYVLKSVELRQFPGFDALNDKYLMSFAKAVAPGVCLDDWATICIEPTTGVLLDFSVPYIEPSAPANLTPGISADAARSSMLAYLGQAFGQGAYDEELPVDLVVWLPKCNRTEHNYLTAAEIAMGEQNQGVLGYTASFKRVNGLQNRYSIYVDAQTGAVKLAWDTGHGFGVGTKALKPLGWDWGLGPISVMNGKKAIVAQNADILSCKPSTIPKTGVKLFIHRGRMNVPIVFDARSGLIWYEIGGKRRYGKPNASLLKALVKVASP